MPEQLIHQSSYDPTGFHLFKPDANARARVTHVYCSAEQCPLRDAGCCAVLGGLFGGSCPYGRRRTEEGPTRRARGMSKWLNDRKKPDVPSLTSPPTKLAFIGDYVYLPYAHMTMCKALPFLAHATFISCGTPFLKKADWTIDNVVTLMSFRPQALMGGEIRTYQQEEIPKFVAHLREQDPAMFSLLCERFPQYDTAPNYIGRVAYLRTLTPPFRYSTRGPGDRNREYNVIWDWDGHSLQTCSKHAYDATWGGITPDTFVLTMNPARDATIIVRDNAWVNSLTVFKD